MPTLIPPKFDDVAGVIGVADAVRTPVVELIDRPSPTTMPPNVLVVAVVKTKEFCALIVPSAVIAILAPILTPPKRTPVAVVNTNDAPGSPFGPCGPCGPLSPCGPVLPTGPCGPVAPVGPVRLFLRKL